MLKIIRGCGDLKRTITFLASTWARNWQERGKKTCIIVRDHTRAEIEKRPLRVFFHGKER
jgi:hypothetical protein